MLKRIERLEQFHNRITSCRVTVEMPNKFGKKMPGSTRFMSTSPIRAARSIPPAIAREITPTRTFIWRSGTVSMPPSGNWRTRPAR
ncbi:hypothetical protein QW131_29265 [Roseibium salinum]|nr:hypothetical protein [Roseibium salinum]